MELELSYWDCLALLNIESEEEARDFDGLCIQPDGITLIVESYRDVLSGPKKTFSFFYGLEMLIAGVE